MTCIKSKCLTEEYILKQHPMEICEDRMYIITSQKLDLPSNYQSMLTVGGGGVDGHQEVGGS